MARSSMRVGHGALIRLHRFLHARGLVPHSPPPTPALQSRLLSSTATSPINSSPPPPPPRTPPSSPDPPPPPPPRTPPSSPDPPPPPPPQFPWLRSKLSRLAQDLRQVPPLAKSLGLAGAIPFVVLSPPIAYVLPLPDLVSGIHTADYAQAAYGAAILSFLGGPHWGMAMAAAESSSPVSFSGYTVATARYVWSVTPSLLGWLALLLPRVPGLAVLAASFVAALVVDWLMVAQGLLPSWYLPLRILLTGIAVLSLGSTLLLLVAKDVPRKVGEKIDAAKKGHE